MNRPLSTHRNASGGYVLIVVLIVCLGLVSLTLYFGHAMMMTYRGSETDLAGRQADRAIEGAVQYTSYLMSNIIASGSTGASTVSSTSGTANSPYYLLPDPTTYQSEAVPLGDATFWFIGDPLQSGSATGGTSTGSVLSYGLVDEASKLNLNTATETMLETLPNMTTNLAQAIVAWRKTSGTSSTTTTGTSATNSSSMANAKGGPFESIYELAQVASVDGDDPTILYGDDTNLNHVQDPNESPGGQFNPGIFEYVTVFSREPNTLPDGTKRINVTAATPALATLLSGTLGATRGEAIARSIRGVTVHSVLEFYMRSGMTEAELDQVTPYLTMSSNTYSVGLINVNTASEAVLECVPGITQQFAQQIVSTRATQATPSTNLAWIAQILGNAAAIQAGPYLTTQTYQVTADVAAVGRYGRGYRRTLFVIDGSTGTPQIVYRHNMASLGLAIGSDALQKLAQTQKATAQ